MTGSAHDRLGDRGQQVGHPLANDVVAGGHPVLHRVEDGNHRGHGDDRDEREAPVVDGHDPGDGDEDGRVDEPGHATPRQELAQLLHVAGDSGDQRAAPLVGLGGQAQPVDVAKGPGAESAERRLTRLHQAAPGQPPRASRGQHDE